MPRVLTPRTVGAATFKNMCDYILAATIVKGTIMLVWAYTAIYKKQEVAGSFPKRYMTKPLFFTIIWTEWDMENSDCQSELGI